VYLCIGASGWLLSAVFVERGGPWWKELLSVLLWPAVWCGLRL